jgi:UDP-N-acetylglucosamine transferase subunit ALG13
MSDVVVRQSAPGIPSHRNTPVHRDVSDRETITDDHQETIALKYSANSVSNVITSSDTRGYSTVTYRSSDVPHSHHSYQDGKIRRRLAIPQAVCRAPANKA